MRPLSLHSFTDSSGQAKMFLHREARRSCKVETNLVDDLYQCIMSIRINSVYNKMSGTRWRSWLRHYATSRKVAGSNPDEVIGFVN
jgi:hypothetical protein